MFRKHRPFVSYVKLKKWGRYYAALTLLLGFAAVNSGNNLLYFFLAALLSIMALSGFISYLSLKSIYLTIIAPEELYAKTINYLKVRVKNRSPLPLFLIYVKKSDREKLVFEVIPPSGLKEGFLPCYFEKRGYNVVESIFVGTTFPLSFTIREMFYPVNLKLLVFPHIYKIRKDIMIESPENTGWGAESSKEGAIGDFIGLREYTFQDKVSRIHWKKIKDEKLYAKKFQDENFQVLNIEITSTASEDEIERVASLAVYYLEQGHSVGLKIDGKATISPDSGIKQKIKILEELALLGYES
uniref:DUF58 domain-containing protein n=1 Tax=candidate division WOR-3 bacterium TaxID=2052148 RepID=A0A7V4E5T4_UNCW3